MLRIKAGMNQKDGDAGLVFAGYALRAVFPTVVVRPRRSASWSVWTEGPFRVFLLFTRPLCATTGAIGYGVQETAEFPQLLIMQVVDISLVVQRPISMVLVTMEILQLRVDTVVDGPFLQSCSSLSCRRGLFPWSRLFCGPLHVDTVADVPVAD